MGPLDGSGNPVAAPVVPPTGVAPAGAPAPVAPPPTTPADAARQLGEAQAAADTQIAGVTAEAAAQDASQLLAIQQAQQAHAAALRQANQETADAFKAAREMEPTGFWEGRPGKEVHAAIARGLGRVAQVLGHMANNSTADMIDAAIDRHYRGEKEKIDRAFQYAAQKGKLTQDMRDQYAQELLALQSARAATTAASAEKIRAITAASQGKIDKAKAELDAQKLEQSTAQQLEENRQLRLRAGLVRAQTAETYADIARKKDELKVKQDEEARKVAADAAKVDAAKAKAEKGTQDAFERRARDFEQKTLEGTSRSPGPMQLYRQLGALENTISQAIKSGDQQKAMAAVLTIEQGSRALSGAAPTKTSTHLIQETASLGDEIQKGWGRLTGNPTASDAFMKRLRTLVQQGKQEKLEISNAAIKDFETKELDPTTGVSIGTPVEAYARKRIEGFKKGSQNEGAKGVPVTVKMKDGTVVKALKMPDGKLVRQ